MDKKLNIELYIGGERVETLTDEQCDRIAQRLSSAMSLYYSRHPEEYRQIT